MSIGDINSESIRYWVGNSYIYWSSSHEESLLRLFDWSSWYWDHAPTQKITFESFRNTVPGTFRIVKRGTFRIVKSRTSFPMKLANCTQYRLDYCRPPDLQHRYRFLGLRLNRIHNNEHWNRWLHFQGRPQFGFEGVKSRHNPRIVNLQKVMDLIQKLYPRSVIALGLQTSTLS